MGGYSCANCYHEIESMCRTLNGPFSHLFVVKLYWCLKTPKINKKEVGEGQFNYNLKH